MSEGIDIDRDMTCPRTGGACEWVVYCSLRKNKMESGGDVDNPLRDFLVERVSAEELSELSNIGYCAVEMIEAAVSAVESPDRPAPAELTQTDMDFLARNDPGRE